MSQQERSDAGGDSSIKAFGDFATKYEKGTGGTTRYIAQRLMERSPPFLDGSVILDNACGTGIVVEEVQNTILSSPDTAKDNIKIQVYAADAATQMVDILRAKANHAESHGTWPNISSVRIEAVPAENLDESIVPSNSITHSYMNFGLFFCFDPIKAAQHIYRSLAPKGTALVTCWADFGYLGGMRKTEKVLNPGGEDFKMPFGDQWEDPSYIKTVLCQAGFAEENVKVIQQESFFRGNDLEDLADLQANLFSMLVKGKQSIWNTEEAKRKWIDQLREIIPHEQSFVQESNGVATRMLANIAICTK